MKVVFMGLHHKPGKTALDSSTRSGQVIDQLIGHLPESWEFEKANLFPYDYHPDGEELREAIEDFQPKPETTYVLLGRCVQRYIGEKCPIHVRAHHPGYALRKGAVNEYVGMTALAIMTCELDLSGLSNT